MDAYFIAQKYSPEILKIEGVVGVGASRGRILVFVKDPKAIPLLPKAIEQIPVEVEVRKPFEFLKLQAEVDPKARLRPTPAGCSVGVPVPLPGLGIPYGTTGTLGAWAFADRKLSILSNNHVIAGFNQYPLDSMVIQPGPVDGGKLDDQIATLSHFVPIIFVPSGTPPSPEIMNLVDVALAETTLPGELVDRAIIEIGEPLAFNLTPLEGMKVKKFGRSSGLTLGEIISTSLSIVTAMPPLGIAYFQDLIAAELETLPGDSGSVVLDEKNQVLGLLFAASADKVAICKIANVVNQLGVELAILPPLPFPVELLFGATVLGAVGELAKKIVKKQYFADTSSDTVGFGQFNLLKFALEEAFKRVTGKMIEEIIE